MSNSKRSRKRSSTSENTSLLYFPPIVLVLFLTVTMHRQIPLERLYSTETRVDVIPFSRMHLPFLPTSVVDSLSTWLLFTLQLVSSSGIGFRILRKPPPSTAVFYRSVLRSEKSWKSRIRFLRNQGEFPHTMLSSSLVISGFVCGSRPFQLEFVFVGFALERA
jgi:hypothetical protein